MGCFSACFGSSKTEKRRKQRKHKLVLRDQIYGSSNSLQYPQEKVISADPPNINQNADIPDGLEEESSSFVNEKTYEIPNYMQHQTLSQEKVTSAEPLQLDTDIADRGEESSLSTRKKVTFDTNVKTYEPISVYQSAELFSEIEKKVDDQRDSSDNSSLLSISHSEDDSITSSVGSYPPNHRYQNCRDSDDESEEFDCKDSDLENENYDTEEYSDSDEMDNVILDQKLCNESVLTASRESGTANSSEIAAAEKVNSPLLVTLLAEKEEEILSFNRNARDRSVHAHSVRNPVENIAQWKAEKSKATPRLKPQKENFTDKYEESRLSFSFMSKSDQNQEISVDASLSSWLSSSKSTPVKKVSPVEVETGRSYSPGSYSEISLLEDRPILGALTVEEIKQFSASNSPRKSPSRSPDEMPIIGTVGRYWNSSGSAEDYSSATSSYKGIPNSTSKYREDKKVIWHSTPFETRLERALQRGDIES